MKIYNIALTAIALTFSPTLILANFSPTLILAKETVQDTPTFQTPPDHPDNGENTTRYIVKFKPGSAEFRTRMQQASRHNSVGNLRRSAVTPDNQLLAFGSFLPRQNAQVVYLSSEAEVRRWKDKDDVEYVEPDGKVYLQAEETPYGISKVHAFDIPDGAVANRKVCIIDTGFDINHPDLASANTIVTGYSGEFSAGTWSTDGHGHGTHVAGTIAAIGGNNQGVVGVNRNGQLKLHIVKVFNDSGNWAWQSSLVAAVEECVESGANVVNMSLGGGGFSQTEYDAYESIATVDNVLLVAAAGNGGNTAYSYPASYDYVMSVAATDSSNNLASFSQRNDQVDIAAPGVAVLSTLPTSVSASGYASWSGTSMATPHVAGVAALLWSLDTGKTAQEIRAILEQSAEDLGVAGRDDSYGHGLVRADRAKDLLDGFTLSPTTSPTAAPPCTDSPEGWYDSDGATYNCAWYAQGSNCAVYGNGFENFGKTANEACCVCGGGETGTRAPTTSPTASTTASPTASPSASPTASPSASPTTSPTSAPTVYDDDNIVDDCPEGQALLRVEVVTDANGFDDNKFVVKKKNDSGEFRGNNVWIQNDFENSATEIMERCLPVDKCYQFVMIDFGLDGMCCEAGEGGYKVTWNGNLVQDTLTNLSFTDGKKSRSPEFGSC